MNPNYGRTAGLLISLMVLISALVPISLSNDENHWWNDSWSFRKNIVIPINTSSEEAKFQPIDIHMEFNESCWAKSEFEHSIRVIFQHESRYTELELQIYELNFSDNEHITSCNLVFLIPKEANGKEKYYVYYDDDSKPSPNYQKRVNVEESYYQYAPIQGLSFESSFYKVTEEGDIIYGINKQGKIMGKQASQQVTKLKKGSKDATPSNNDNMASFNLRYWIYKNGKWYETSNSADKLISNQIFVNGNLMIKVGIITQSNDGLIQTTAIYKYYYCPTENKRLYTHVKEEIIKYPLPTGSEIDVAFVKIYCGGIKSSIIKELNFGDIPPYLHFYSDDGRIVTQELDQYPDYTNWQLLVKKQDDYDLGSSPWVSVDYGETGKAHAIIFETNKVLKSGANERDGIEIQICESKNIQYPGLDGRVAEIYLTRNAYEKNEPLDETLPADYVIEFNAEYFTTENGGYVQVKKEADIYQKLISYQPKNENNVTGGIEEEERYSLTIYAHLSSSLLLKSISSKLLLKNAYLSAELLNDGTRYGRMNRISLKENLKIDWKNISFFQKIVFSDVSAGKYLVKIWLENSLFNKEKEFIGYAIIDLQKDKKVHIFCKPEGKIIASVLDQNKDGIENTKMYLVKDGVIIAESYTNSSGKATIKAPTYPLETYTLNATYKGFFVYNEIIKFGVIRRFIPMTKTIKFDVHDLKITFRDSDEKAPSFDLNLGLISNEMQEPIIINPNNSTNGTYLFSSIYPANYDLKITYNSFDIVEKIRIPNLNSLTINLYDFTINIMDNWDLKSEVPLDVSLTNDDFEKTVVMCGNRLSNYKYVFSEIYPGSYKLKATYKTFTVEESFDIHKNLDAEIKLSAVFNVTTKILDARGNQMGDARVIMNRGEKEIQGVTNKEGYITFSIPPGVYVNKIYYGNELIAERKVDILNEKSYSVVTTNEPLYPFIIIGLSLVLVIAALIISYKKKDAVFFLKIFAIALILIAVFLPWWAVHGSTTNSHFETSTNLYFLPVNMITIISNENVTAGELVLLDENFVSVINIVIVVIGLSTIGIIANLILDRYNKKKISLIISIILITGLIVSIVLSFYAISELASATVGGIIGNENLDANIIGENMYVKVPCSWGPSYGFYLLLVAIIVLILIFFIKLRKIFFMSRQ